MSPSIYIQQKMFSDIDLHRLWPRDWTIALCHGNFDLVHPGHLAHFEFARSFADTLIVSVNDDVSCRASNKGPGRPLLNEAERAYNLASLHQVDWVYICPAPTPDNLISVIRPNVYVKGAEYAPELYGGPLPEQPALEAVGCSLVFGPKGYIHSSRRLTADFEAGGPTHA